MLEHEPFSTRVALGLLPRWRAQGYDAENLRLLRDLLVPLNPSHSALRDALIQAQETLEGEKTALDTARSFESMPGNWTPNMLRLLDPEAFGRRNEVQARLQIRLERRHGEVLTDLESPGEGFYHLGEFAAGRSWFESQAHPYTTDLLWAGLSALKENRYPQAEVFLQRAKHLGEEARADLALAELYSASNQVTELKKMCVSLESEAERTLSPLERALKHELFAQLLARLGRPQEGLQEAERAWTHLNNAAQAPLYAARMLATLAQLHLAVGQNAAALKALESAMQTPAGVELRILKRRAAQALIRLGRFRSAHWVLEELKLLAGPPQSAAQLELDRAELDWVAGRLETATAGFKRALQIGEANLSPSETLQARLSLAALLAHNHPLQALEQLKATRGELAHPGEILQIRLREIVVQEALSEVDASEATNLFTTLAGQFAERGQLREQVTATLRAANSALGGPRHKAVELLAAVSWIQGEAQIEPTSLSAEWHLLPQLADFARNYPAPYPGSPTAGLGAIELSILGHAELCVGGQSVEVFDSTLLRLMCYLREHGPTAFETLSHEVLAGEEIPAARARLKTLAQTLSQAVPGLRLNRHKDGKVALESDRPIHWDAEEVRRGLVARLGRSVTHLGESGWLQALESKLTAYA